MLINCVGREMDALRRMCNVVNIWLVLGVSFIALAAFSLTIPTHRTALHVEWGRNMEERGLRN